MSVKIMSLVWELDIEHSERIILLAMADHANDDGQNCYPSNAYLAWKTGYSERSVRRIHRALELTGIITRVAHQEGGRGFATEYRLNVEKGDKKSPFSNEKRRTSTTLKEDICDIKEDTGDHKGGHSCVPPIISNHQRNIMEPLGGDTTEKSPDYSDGQLVTPDLQSIDPGPTGPTEPSKKRQGTVTEPPDYPEWFQPLVGLKGFKATAHKLAIQSIRDGCDEASVNEAEIVLNFANYYRDGGRAINGWSDPVAALVRTLPVQIAKGRRSVNRPPPQRVKTDYVAMKAELDARRARG
jgi:hypothetical protein